MNILESKPLGMFIIIFFGYVIRYRIAGAKEMYISYFTFESFGTF